MKKFIAVIITAILLLSNLVLPVSATKQEAQILNAWNEIIATSVISGSTTTSRHTTVEFYQSGTNKFAYVGFANGNGSSSEALIVYNVTDPTNVIEVARYTNIVTRIMNAQFVVTHGYLIVSSRQSNNNNSLVAYPINTDGTLSGTGVTITTGGNGIIDTVYACDDYLFYALAGTNGRHIKVYDISNLSEGAVLLGNTENNYGVYSLEVEKIADNKYLLYYISRNASEGFQLCINEMTVDSEGVSFNERFHGTTGLENANSLYDIKDIQLIDSKKVLMVIGASNSGKYSRYVIDVSNDTVSVSEISESRALSVVDINDAVYAIGTQDGNILFMSKEDNSQLHSIASGLGQVYDMDIADGKLFVAGQSKFGVFDLYSYISIDMDDIGEINDGILNIQAEIECRSTDIVKLEIFGEELDVTDEITLGNLDFVQNLNCADGDYNAVISIVRGDTVLLSDEKTFTVRKTMPLEITNSSLSVGTTTVTGVVENTHNQATSAATAYLVIYNSDGSMNKVYPSVIPALEKGETSDISFTLDEAVITNQVVKLFVVDNSGKVISDIVETAPQTFNSITDNIPPVVVDAVNVYADVNPDTVVAQISGQSACEAENIVFIKVYKPEPNSTELDYINAFESLDNGGFYCSYPLVSGVEGENYTVQVYTTGANVLYGEKQFSYISQQTIDDALTAVYNATAETFESIAISSSSQYKTIFNLNTSIYDTLIDTESNKYKLAVGEAVAGTLYTNIAELNTAFDNAVNEQKAIMDFDNMLKSAVADINGSSLTDLPSKTEGHASVLELNITGLYTELDSTMKGCLYSNWIYNKNFAQPSDIQSAFKNGVAIEYLKYAQFGSVVEDSIIENYYVELGLNYEDVQTYSALGLQERKDAIIYFLDLDLTEYGALGSQFNDSLSNFDNNFGSVNNNNNNNSTVITGGGGGGGMTITPSAKVPEDITKEELIPQEILQIEKKNIFKDVKFDDWFFEAVCLLNEKKIVEGITVDEFKPGQNVKREEFAKMIISAFGLIDYSADTTFTDVTRNRWYYSYIASAQKLNLINGIGDNQFGVGRDITRQDLAKLVYDTMKSLGRPIENAESVPFTDMNVVSDYAKDAVNAMYAKGIMNGFEDNTFRPYEPVTRAMAAQVIYRLISVN